MEEEKELPIQYSSSTHPSRSRTNWDAVHRNILRFHRSGAVVNEKLTTNSWKTTHANGREAQVNVRRGHVLGFIAQVCCVRVATLATGTISPALDRTIGEQRTGASRGEGNLENGGGAQIHDGRRHGLGGISDAKNSTSEPQSPGIVDPYQSLQESEREHATIVPQH